MVVAIDGPAGSGKGTICKKIGSLCNLLYIDTGVTYRCVAYQVLKNNVDLEDKDSIIDIASKINIQFTTDSKVFLEGEEVTDKIRTMEVSKTASIVSSIPRVRELMVDLQRSMAGNNDVIMEGRDITTVVYPNADYKFYLDASIKERARRRFEQNKEKGIESSLEEIEKQIEERDYNDMHKEVGALKRTSEQIYIDSSDMTIDEVIDEIRKVIGR